MVQSLSPCLLLAQKHPCRLWAINHVIVHDQFLKHSYESIGENLAVIGNDGAGYFHNPVWRIVPAGTLSVKFITIGGDIKSNSVIHAPATSRIRTGYYDIVACQIRNMSRCSREVFPLSGRSRFFRAAPFSPERLGEGR